MRMETTMYDENMSGSVKQLKSKMTLDLNGPVKPKSNLLSSPDLNICTLASPELERMIIQQQNGIITTTPTPTQFLCPKVVTEEQEAYALGFVNALQELKNQENRPAAQTSSMTMTTLQPVQCNPATSAVSIVQAQHQLPASQPMHTSSSYAFTTTTSVPGGNVMSSSSAPMPTVVAQQSDMMSQQDLSRTSSPAMMQTHTTGMPTVVSNHRLMQLKEEPQTVPCYSSSGSTPPMSPGPAISPVNMDHQEKIKVDRKRARNRVAARKCRYRKLERISKLEDRVKELTGQKDQLAVSANELRSQVARLKQQIMEHVHSGCKVMLNSNLL